MKVHIVGGGPAGLYFGLLMKRLDPGHEVVIFERNPRGSTFGWGVVFSDKTLSYLQEPDAQTYEELTRRLVTWEDVEVVHRGRKVTIRGNRFSGIARLALLDVLERRCLELGVDLRFASEVSDVEALAAEADLLVGADGLRSVVRERWRDAFQPSLDVRKNRYVWYGTPRLFHALTLTFREDAAGLWIAHSYEFSAERSTFIVECDEATWSAAGMDARPEPEARRYLERIFAPDLAGQPLLPNKSEWIRFVTVRNRRWSHGRVVLLGDALHTAHFSIGSGTKLALEDSIALARALSAHPRAVEAALASFERERRPSIELYQEAAQASLEWFETARTDLHLDPLAFAYRVMTRSDKLDHENLRRRDPEFVAAYERTLDGASSPAGTLLS